MLSLIITIMYLIWYFIPTRTVVYKSMHVPVDYCKFEGLCVTVTVVGEFMLSSLRNLMSLSDSTTTMTLAFPNLT
jgi:hypothetical protein